MIKKKFEILNSLPPYGPMYISITESGEEFFSEGFVVRFFKDDGTNWVANFQPGWTDLNDVMILQESHNLLIIANGICYIINPNQTQPIAVFGMNYKAVFEASNHRIVLFDDIGLTIIESDGSYWHSERISWDGLADINVENNLVCGLAFNPMADSDDWIDFSYDIDSKKLIGGSYYTFEKKKPWWKLW